MMKMKRLILTILVVALSALCLTGCWKKDQGSVQPQPQATASSSEAAESVPETSEMGAPEESASAEAEESGAQEAGTKEVKKMKSVDSVTVEIEEGQEGGF